MVPLTIPKLSMSDEPVRVVAWLVADGASVSRGDPVAELETDKSNMEIEAPATGVLRIVVEAGADADVDAVIAHVEDGSGEPGVAEVEAPAAVAALRPAPAPAAAPGQRRAVASPAARRLAAEAGVDLESLAGTGPGGRVVAADVSRAAVAAGAAGAPEVRDAVVAGLSASWRDIPHIHIGGRIEAEGLAKARAALGSAATVTDLLAFALVKALREVPTLNGTYAGEARLSDAVHLSLAVATGGGVAAPTIRDAHLLDLEQLSEARRRVVELARAGRLEKRDLGGGTVTLSNLGAYPVDFFAPVIAGPQICLVATGRLAQEPVGVDGMIALRHRIWVNVAIDHRAADGEAGGRLLAALEQQLSALTMEEGR